MCSRSVLKPIPRAALTSSSASARDWPPYRVRAENPCTSALRSRTGSPFSSKPDGPSRTVRSPNRTGRVSDSRPPAYTRIRASCSTGDAGDHSGASTFPSQNLTGPPLGGTGSSTRSPSTSAATVASPPALVAATITSMTRLSGSAFAHASAIRAGPRRSSQTLCQIPP